MKRAFCIAILAILALQPFASFAFPTGEVSGEKPPISGTWHGVLHLNSLKLNLVLHLDGDSTCTLDSPDQGAKDIAGVVKELTAEKINVQFPMLLATYTGELKDGQLVGTFKQRDFTLPLTLTPGDLVRSRPQTPTPPFPYETREVTIPLSTGENKGGATLAGTLTLPTAFGKGKATLCLLLVSGSGLQDRDETLFDHKPFAVIADYLARHGVATLRYDDRGFGQSTGDPSLCTTADFAQDAAACIAFLRSTPLLKGGKGGKLHIGILGHSEGGSIAFMLAAGSKFLTPNSKHQTKPDFIVTLAAPGIRGDTLIVEQANAILRQTGQPANMTVKRMHLTMAMQPQNPWYDFFTAYDPADDIAATRCPVLALNGSLDCQVLPQSNLTAIRHLSAQNSKLSTKEYPGLNHLFQHATTGDPAEYGMIEETIAEEVLRDIVDWISSLKF